MYATARFAMFRGSPGKGILVSALTVSHKKLSVGRSMNGSMNAVSGRGRATTSPLSTREKPAPEEPS
jgi:hypothetical protein